MASPIFSSTGQRPGTLLPFWGGGSASSSKCGRSARTKHPFTASAAVQAFNARCARGRNGGPFDQLRAGLHHFRLLAGYIIHLDANAVRILEQDRVRSRSKLRVLLCGMDDFRSDFLCEACNTIDVLAASRPRDTSVWDRR